jgi:OmpA-OmpF porin, OOP family
MSSTRSSNTWRLIGAILLLLLLIFLWMTGRGPSDGCCGDAAVTQPAVAPPPPVVAASPTPAPTPAPAPIAAKVNGLWENGKLTLTGEVGSDADKKRLVDAAFASYGAGNVIDQLTVKAGLTALTGVTLTGTVPSDADKAARGDAAIKAFAPANVDNQLVVQAPAPAAPVAAAEKAPDCSKAMQLNVLFATGRSELTPQGKRYLNDVVKCVTGSMLVGGHTDNVGSAKLNAKLSAARANSVKAYLVGKGVKSELLSTEGFGPSKPVADNGTKEGRAKNRRIELTAK